MVNDQRSTADEAMLEDPYVPASVADGAFALILLAVDGEHDRIQELSASLSSNVAK